MPYKDPTKAIENQRKRSKSYRERHRETLLERGRLYDKTDARKTKRRAARLRRFAALSPEKQATYYREQNLKRLYKITLAEFDKLLDAQGGRCKICREVATEWHTDHDHKCCAGRSSCGKCLRGLLCEQCNLGLGAFKDRVSSLESAIAYLNLPHIDRTKL